MIIVDSGFHLDNMIGIAIFGIIVCPLAAYSAWKDKETVFAIAEIICSVLAVYILFSSINNSFPTKKIKLTDMSYCELSRDYEIVDSDGQIYEIYKKTN